MRESQFQNSLISEIKRMFPGCMVLKNDPNYIQGIPDLTILYKGFWAFLECKKSEREVHQPNQDYYISEGDKLSFARFVYPENKEEVLNELQQAFQSRRKTRFSKRIQVPLD